MIAERYQRWFEYEQDSNVKVLASPLDAFTHAEKLWPSYHSVAEIKKLLQENQTTLTAAPREGKSEV